MAGVVKDDHNDQKDHKRVGKKIKKAKSSKMSEQILNDHPLRHHETVEIPLAVNDERPGPSNDTIPREESEEERRARRKAEKAARSQANPSADEDSPLKHVSPDKRMPVEIGKKEKKKRKLDLETDVGPAPGNESRKKKERKSDGESADQIVVNVPGEKKKKKKKKDRKAKGEEEEVILDDKPVDLGEVVNKDEVKEVIVQDVLTDPTLSDQAKKALHYVHLHASSRKSNSPSGSIWKFNKARQNWLLRNIWNDEVPDQWVEPAIKYLCTIQGAGRTILVDTAKSHLTPSETAASTGDEVQEGETVDKSGETDVSGRAEPKDGAEVDGTAQEDTGADELRGLRKLRAASNMSLQDRLSTLEPKPLFNAAAGLSLVVAASTQGYSYNFALSGWITLIIWSEMCDFVDHEFIQY
ncbi:hypothetical protein TREMEDRAFT_64275 [Tremella mesenterica DSM 1558]|uniref:uncharacterized protein n=1 Tax=Tremella mesenterica (strain ATCC 24925 / CBS 8224 / DSM 1558 / NBRC 9311 / NRRL Y-6157 / RJB 2259-6 / UBC 559-6) TaxID=578456 RepID=UPI0003F4A30F|nr:uncharacterized protein TREMEDRAFT_64275 [Tremella mesenterica DSM 1558]EIW67681.1 hypothetical protein TREMEDRAFT_64275 [Tremella mesenterica DSM 1558]